MNGSDQPDGVEHPAPNGSASPVVAAPTRSRRLLVIALGVLLAVASVAWLTRSAPDREVAGAQDIDGPAPDFSLDLFDGATFTLADHLAQDGRPVVMNLWASWCVPCRQEMPAFDTVARRHPEVLFLGVAVEDTETAARRFAEEVGVSYPLGFDADGTILERYPTLGLPTTWFITAERTIAARWIGQLDETHLQDLIVQHLSG